MPEETSADPRCPPHRRSSSSGPHPTGRASSGIGRSYWAPVGGTNRLKARPPFKPCMRISRTRLTRRTSVRSMHHPRIPNRAAQASEPQGLEERTTPSLRPTSRQTRPRALPEQAAPAAGSNRRAATARHGGGLQGCPRGAAALEDEFWSVPSPRCRRRGLSGSPRPRTPLASRRRPQPATLPRPARRRTSSSPTSGSRKRPAPRRGPRRNAWYDDLW